MKNITLTKISDVMSIIAATLILGLFLYAVLNSADVKSKEVLKVGDCVRSQMMEQNFPGTEQEGWNIFADYCFKKNNI